MSDSFQYVEDSEKKNQIQVDFTVGFGFFFS